MSPKFDVLLMNEMKEEEEEISYASSSSEGYESTPDLTTDDSYESDSFTENKSVISYDLE